jgi:predicted site-specific integrase-resolvase
MSKATEKTKRPNQWVSFAAAAKMVGVSPQCIARIARKGHLTVKELPGGKPKVLVDEVGALVQRSIRPATVAQACPVGHPA